MYTYTYTYIHVKIYTCIHIYEFIHSSTGVSPHAQGVLDAVFYACLSDAAPFTSARPMPHQAPMPKEVAAADKVAGG